MITIEEKDIVITRISDDNFTIEIGDIEMGIDYNLSCYVGEKITIPIPGILVSRNSNKALLCKLSGDI